MAHNHTDEKNGTLSMPLIIGLVIGVTVSVSTGQWWWSTVGVLIGAAVGAIGTYYGRRRRTPHR